MTPNFDPYYTWLGIPREEQPPNFYRLLGLSLFESNNIVIGNSADRQVAFLRRHESSKYGQLATSLIKEVIEAKLVLVDPVRKMNYDAQLRHDLLPEPGKIKLDAVHARAQHDKRWARELKSWYEKLRKVRDELAELEQRWRDNEKTCESAMKKKRENHRHAKAKRPNNRFLEATVESEKIYAPDWNYDNPPATITPGNIAGTILGLIIWIVLMFSIF